MYDENGRFMRRTNIDELPQFSMCLWGAYVGIGPRPHMLKHTNNIPSYQQLCGYLPKPGISGWAG
jgi:lipopolysaccharide/colanic/teichoic acid biosynthesis glycosyltransferase